MKRLLILSLIFVACNGAGGDDGGSGGTGEKNTKQPIEKTFPADPSLVTVQSTYKDTLAPHDLKTVQGTGFIVQAGERTFVLTASHVSQGKDLVIQLGTKKLEILGRLYDGLADVEVIEVEKGLPTQFHLKDKDIVWTGTPETHAKWIDKHNFVPMNPWVYDPNLHQDNAFQKPRNYELFCDSFCYSLNTQAIMQPGSSGSPLVQFFPLQTDWESGLLPMDAREGYWGTPFGTYRLRGLVMRRERFYSRSAFVPYSKINKVVQEYLQGIRTKEPQRESVWELQNDVLSRRNGGVSEAMALGGSSGNGISMDGGDLAKFEEDNPKSIFDRITAYPGAEQEGYFWIMMMRHPTTSQMISFPSWFDMEQYAHQKRWVMGLSPNKEDVVNILNIFRSRFGSMGPPTETKDTTGAVTLLIAKEEVSVAIQLSSSDAIQFKLNIKGYACQETCTSRFDPVVELHSLKGQAYLVDMRGLFFVDSNHSRSNIFRNKAIQNLSEKEYQKLFFDEFTSEGQRLRLSIRKKRANSTSPMTAEEGLPIQFEWSL